MEGHYDLQQDFFWFSYFGITREEVKMIRVKTRPFSSV